MTRLKKVVITAALSALSVILPMAFHALPNAGIFLSPMHIPAYIAGLTVGPGYGIVAGLLGPLLSSLITGMPAFSRLPAMMVELSSYAFFSGIFLLIIHTKSYVADLYISLLLSMIAGRIVAGVVRALIFSSGSYSFNAWLTSYFISTWPAVIMQLAVIPAVVFSLALANLIPRRA